MARAFTLPLGEHDYEFTTSLGDDEFGFRLRWNSRDSSWYLDLADADGVAIASGVRLVLGVKLGARSAHPFFNENLLYLIDMSGRGAEAGIDDLGRRVLLVWTSLDELATGGV